MKKVFLLSPAWMGGLRAQMLTRPEAQFDVALKLRSGQASLGEIYSFVSGLYFRGKLAYASTFADPPADASASLVIAPGLGLVGPETLIDRAQYAALSRVSIDPLNSEFIDPLLRDATALAERVGPDSAVVLLGSIATAKYTDALRRVFGARLLFPAEFVGRGDMSRGGLMLRHAEAHIELTYVPVEGAVLRGTRPAKLPKKR